MICCLLNFLSKSKNMSDVCFLSLFFSGLYFSCCNILCEQRCVFELHVEQEGLQHCLFYHVLPPFICITNHRNRDSEALRSYVEWQGFGLNPK